MTTFAPCEASSSAVARPMPRAEPVTMATLSSRTPMLRSLFKLSGEGREHYVPGGNAGAMKLYPDVPGRRATTIALDVATLLAVLLFAWLGTVVHDGVEELIVVSNGVQTVGGDVEGAF